MTAGAPLWRRCRSSGGVHGANLGLALVLNALRMTMVGQEAGTQKAPGNLEKAKAHEIGAKRYAEIDEPARPLEFRRDLIRVELVDIDRAQGSDDAGEQGAAEERKHDDWAAGARFEPVDQHVDPDMDAGAHAEGGAELR